MPPLPFRFIIRRDRFTFIPATRIRLTIGMYDPVIGTIEDTRFPSTIGRTIGIDRGRTIQV